VEGAGGVNDGFEGGVGDHGFLEGVGLRDVFDDCEVELVFSVLGFCFFDLVGFGLRAHCSDDGVSMFEEDIKDVGGDEAASTCTASVHVYFGFGGAGQLALEFANL